MQLRLIQDNQRSAIRSRRTGVNGSREPLRQVITPSPPASSGEVIYRQERLLLIALMSALSWLVFVLLFVTVM
jgi:hypothetical protein